MSEMFKITEEFPRLFERALEYKQTCSVYNPIDKSVTFAKTLDALNSLKYCNKELFVLTSGDIWNWFDGVLPEKISVYPIYNKNVQYVFTCIHNWINRDRKPKENIIGENCNIHPSVIMDVPGHTFIFSPNGKRIDIKHMGNVVIGNEVDIDALSIVHISSMASTIIGNRTKICVKCNIGHDCIIGEDNIFAPGVLLAGGTKIGNNCYIWQGVITRGHISICNNVVIGAGAVVTRNITEPGVYYGNPARYIKGYDPDIR